jgi:hypothetical protein
MISSSARADSELDFYYTRIEEVVQVNDPNPDGWWEQAKAFGKGIVNSVHNFWNKEIRQNFFPKSGNDLVFSKKDKNIAYRVTRERVRDEAHLLELMGASSAETLTDGQKAMLEVFRFRHSQAIRDRQGLAYLPKVNVHLVDTTGFDDERVYPHVRDDFWPNSTGFAITMNSARYNYSGSEDDARSTFLHEFCHSLDVTMKEFSKPYGADGRHYANEQTRPRTAFLEGWAQFNEMLEFPAEVAGMGDAIKRVRIESRSTPGSYTQMLATDPSLTGPDLLSVEGINAMIMYRLATELPDGRAKVFAAFKDSNRPWRNLSLLTRALVKKHPADAALMAKIFDEVTHGKLSDAELKTYVGSHPAVDEYLNGRTAQVSTPVVSEVTRPEESVTGAIKGAVKVLTSPERGSTNPFVSPDDQVEEGESDPKRGKWHRPRPD